MKHCHRLSLLLAVAYFFAFTVTGAAFWQSVTQSTIGYAGPGDVVGSASAWWGLRAYNLAYANAGGNAIDIVDQAGANPLTVTVLASGALDVASISTWVTAHSVTTILVAKLWDQSGGTLHLAQANLTKKPVLSLTGGPGATLPAMQFTAANFTNLMVTPGAAISQPLTLSWVAKHTSSGGVGQVILGSNTGAYAGYTDAATPNNVFIYAGGATSADGTASDGSWHSAQAFFAVGNANTIVDGVTQTSTATAGTKNIVSGQNLALGSDGGNLELFDGGISEMGIWPVQFSGGQLTNMYNNQHTYYGGVF